MGTAEVRAMVGKWGRRGKSIARRGYTKERGEEKQSVRLHPSEGATTPGGTSPGLRLVGSKQMGGVPVPGITSGSRAGARDLRSAHGRKRAIPLPEAHMPREILGDAAALFRAARLGRGDDVSRLLQKGADPDLTDDPGDQHRDAIAFMCQNEDLGKLDLDGMKLGRTSCHMAAIRGHGEVLQALIEGGCDVNFHDHAGETPLMLVARKGFAELAALLVRSGAQVDARDLRGATALLRAAEAGHAETVRLLLEARAGVNVWDCEKRTPLIVAAARLDEETVRLLLETGADPGPRDVRGADALCAAVCATESPGSETPVRGVEEGAILRIVTRLLDAGAGRGPEGLDIRLSRWARERGHQQVARLLLDRDLLDRCPPDLFASQGP